MKRSVKISVLVVELAACENAETGRAIEWPPAPLTVRGSFAGLPHVRR